MIPYEKAVRIDRIPVQQARTVRATAAAATTTFRNYRINLTFLLPSFIYFITATNEKRTRMNRIESNRYRGTVQ